MAHQNYEGGGFEVTIRCTGSGTLHKHRYDFGRVVFTSVPFSDSPFGDAVRESWAVDGGWIGILGIELGHHKDGSFRRAKVPATQIFDLPPDLIEGGDNSIKLVVACPVCIRNDRLSQGRLTSILAQQMKAGRHIFDVSKPS